VYITNADMRKKFKIVPHAGFCGDECLCENNAQHSEA